MASPHSSPDGIEVGQYQTPGVNDKASEPKATGKGMGSAKSAGMPHYFAHHPPTQETAHKRPMGG